MPNVEKSRSEPARSTEAPLTEFELQVSGRGNGTLTVRLVGELDMTTACLLDGVLRQQVDPQLVCLDLSRLRFLDCAGLRPIVAANARLRARHGRLVLTHAGPRHRRLLQMVGLEELLSAVDEAAARWGGETHA